MVTAAAAAVVVDDNAKRPDEQRAQQGTAPVAGGVGAVGGGGCQILNQEWKEPSAIAEQVMVAQIPGDHEKEENTNAVVVVIASSMRHQ